ncbi:hypothetical protein N7519_008665 [Penicillium mononematosum]|uniref:uncharacterized protein n=1 Tax=Penicillium mononematosum TaxID=268346 RepID=UPI002547FEC9|nr:uncharacterized protein N7519_008665 [Penicillium mononematosum]KAJ6178204.1 hypothetical protein N7519_008665 [Penicillium mononematosum]
MEMRRPSCSNSLPRSEAQIRLCPEKFDESSDNDVQRLPPVDGGFQAWMFLAACVMIEALIWGFAFAFGVFQKYYHAHEPFQDSNMVAVIGTCATGISYLSCPLVIAAMILLPQWGRWFSSFGLIIMCLSLALGSFSSNITHLVLSQGVGFGIGGCIAYSPSILYMDEWVSGIIFPIGLEKLLNRFGFETTLRVISVVVFVLAAPFIYFHKPRLPVRKTVDYQRLNFRFLMTRIFCVYQLGNIIEALGFFLPGIYLPTYARSIGATDFLSSLTVTLLNLASVFGSVTMGHLADRYHAITCITISTVGSTLAVFFLWGFASTLPTLFVFSIAYGLFAGCYSATWAGITHEVRRVDPSADATMIFSVIAFGRGIGNVVSGPLSEAIVSVDSWKGSAVAGYGSGYGLIILSTTTSGASAASTCSPSASDAKVLQFALGVSNFIGTFYNETVNSTFGESNNATIKAYQKILFGLEKGNTLSSQAIEKVGAKAPGFSKPECDYKIPEVNSTQSWAQWAYRFEATVTGAFIGLAGYTESPEVAFLMARLAAEHSEHSSLIGSRVNASYFAQNSTSLVAAYGPVQILSTRNETGSLGEYLGGCLTAPTSPCGPLRIGPLAATPSPSSLATSAAKKI